MLENVCHCYIIYLHSKCVDINTAETVQTLKLFRQEELHKFLSQQVLGPSEKEIKTKLQFSRLTLFLKQS